MNKSLFCRVGDVQCKQFHFFCSDFKHQLLRIICNVKKTQKKIHFSLYPQPPPPDTPRIRIRIRIKVFARIRIRIRKKKNADPKPCLSHGTFFTFISSLELSMLSCKSMLMTRKRGETFFSNALSLYQVF